MVVCVTYCMAGDDDGDDLGCDDQRREDEKLWIKMIFVKKKDN